MKKVMTHKKVANQAIIVKSAGGKTPAEYENYKVVAKEGKSTMIVSWGLSKVNAESLKKSLEAFVNNKHAKTSGAGKTSVKFIVIH